MEILGIASGSLWLLSERALVLRKEQVIVMEQFGEVLELKANGRAVVRVRRHGSCGSCGRCGGFFGEPEKQKETIVEVINPVGAKAGEFVAVETSTSEVLLAAFLLYLVPLSGLLGGIFAGRAWAISRGLAGADLKGLVVGLVLMALIFLLLRLLEGRFERQGRFKAVIKTIIADNADNNVEAGE